MRTEYEEECEQEEGKEECRTEFDYVCEDPKPATYAPPSDGYGIPGAPPISSSTHGSAPALPIPRVDATELPQYRYSNLEIKNEMNSIIFWL